MEDEKIVQLYMDRDETAISSTSEKYGARLRSLAFGITKDGRTAEECENDTYLEAWRLIPPADPSAYFYAFLARITRHVSIDRCRMQKSLKRSADIVSLTEEMESCLPSAGDVEGQVTAKELGEAVSRFLQSLPKEKRVMFVRRYFYLDSVAEIGKRCNAGESKVKTTLFRIRRDLKEYLIKEGYLI